MRGQPRFVRVWRFRMYRLARRLDQEAPAWLAWLLPLGSSITFHGALVLALGLFFYVNLGGENNAGVKIDTSMFASQLKEHVESLGPESDRAGDPFSKDETDEESSITTMPDPKSEVHVVAEMPALANLAESLNLSGTGSGGGSEGAGAAIGSGFAEGAPARLGGGGGGTGGGELTTPFSGRQAAVRAKLVRRQGGSVLSEQAVERGLDWIVRHQRPDGSWSLDHRPQCKGRGCPAGPHMDSDTAATGLALLPLLGAGHNHKEPGRYQKSVEKGLKWLIGHQKPDGELSTSGGNTRMYSHAIAAMALSEAFGLTHDPDLEGPLKKALEFIIKGQNPNDGGWRYSPGEAGDTSVFGWQLFALRSAFLAGLNVPKATIDGANKYLDRAATDPIGATYAYLPGEGPKMSMTAEALLARQYLGWPRQSPPLIAGAERVANDLFQSESRNIYYWYYATQLLHNLQGPAWQLWNVRIRDGLVSIQVVNRGACDNGSWDPLQPIPDQWGQQAGRHFVTCLSILTLEVYYRYLPLYRERDANAIKDREGAAEPAKKEQEKDKEPEKAETKAK